MAFANLVVKISGDISSLDAATKKAIERVKALGSTLSSIGSTAALGISAPLAAFGAVAIKSAADLEALKSGLLVVAKTASAAEVQFTKLREVAKLPGLGFKEAIEGATNLQTLGFSFEKSKNILLQFGNALASVGRGREDLGEVIRQLGQMASRGKVTADNLKPIIERVPQVAGIINREFGTIDTEKLQKLGISAAKLIEVLERELGKAPRFVGGLKNDLENLSESVTLAMADAGAALAPFAKALIDDFAVPAVNRLSGLAKEFKNLDKPMQGFLISLAGIAAGAPLVITALGTIATNVASAAEAFTKLGGAVGVFSKALRLIGWVAVAAEVLNFVNALDQAKEAQLGLEKSGKDYEKVIDKQIKKLRDLGVAVDESNRFKTIPARTMSFAGESVEVLAAQKGTESTKEFIKELNNLALAHGRTVRPAKTAAEVATEVAQATKEAAAAAKKAEHDWNALTKAMGEQATAAALVRSVLGQDLVNKQSGDQLTRQAAIIKAKLDEAADSVAKFRLYGFDAFELPNIDEARVKIKDFTADFDSLEAIARDTAQTLKAISLPSDLGRLSALQNKQRGGFFDAQFEAAVKSGDEALKASAKAAKVYSQQVSLVTNDLAKSIAKLITEGGKFKDVMVDALAEIGKSLIRLALEKQFQDIAKSIQDLVRTHIPSLGKALGSIFGSAGGAAASTQGGIPNLPGVIMNANPAAATGKIPGVGSAAGAATSAGFTAIAGLVTGIVSAVSGVIGNFQMAGMNKSLDLIVKHTLQTANQLIQGIQPQVNAYLPFLSLIHDRLATIVTQGVGIYNAPNDAGLRVAGSGSGSGAKFEFNNCTFGGGMSAEEIGRQIAMQVQLAGA